MQQLSVSDFIFVIRLFNAPALPAERPTSAKGPPVHVRDIHDVSAM